MSDVIQNTLKLKIKNLNSLGQIKLGEKNARVFSAISKSSKAHYYAGS